MVKVVFDYVVPAQKQSDYIKATNEKIKPLWESLGCQSYQVWQEADNPNRFVKEMIFADKASMKGTMSTTKADAVKKIFGSFAEDVTRRVIEQKV